MLSDDIQAERNGRFPVAADASKIAPEGLGEAGRALWSMIAGPYVLDPDEVVLLAKACRQADIVGALEAEVGDELMVTGSKGKRRPNLISRRGSRAIAWCAWSPRIS